MTRPCFASPLSFLPSSSPKMYLMYTLDEQGKRVYTLKVRREEEKERQGRTHAVRRRRRHLLAAAAAAGEGTLLFHLYALLQRPFPARRSGLSRLLAASINESDNEKGRKGRRRGPKILSTSGIRPRAAVRSTWTCYLLLDASPSFGPPIASLASPPLPCLDLNDVNFNSSDLPNSRFQIPSKKLSKKLK